MPPLLFHHSHNKIKGRQCQLANFLFMWFILKIPWIKPLYHFFKPSFALIVALIFSLIFYLHLSPSIAEIIDTYIYPSLDRSIFNWLSFFSQRALTSWMEITYYLLALWVVLFFYFVVAKKDLAPKLFKISVLVSLIAVHWFYLAWGYRYRLPCPIGDIGSFKPSLEDIRQLQKEVGLALSQFDSRPQPQPLEGLALSLAQTMREYLTSAGNITNGVTLPAGYRVKSFSLIPSSMKLLGIMGVYNPLFREIHVNKQLPFGLRYSPSSMNSPRPGHHLGVPSQCRRLRSKQTMGG